MIITYILPQVKLLLLIKHSVSYYLPYENYIYYINKTDGDLMYKLDLNTMQNTRLDINYNLPNKKPFIIYNNNIIIEYKGNAYIYNNNAELLSSFDNIFMDSSYIDNNRISGEMKNISYTFDKNYYAINKEYTIPYYDINI